MKLQTKYRENTVMVQARSEYPLQGICLNSAPGSVAAFLCGSVSE